MNAHACILRIVICLILFSLPLRALAQTATPSEKVNIFKDLIEALGAAGDAITKLTDGIRHLVVTGVEGYDAAKARLIYDDLIDLSKGFTDLMMEQTAFAQSLDHYLWTAAGCVPPIPDYGPCPHPNWRYVVDELDVILPRVNALLSNVRREKSDFVLEPAYETLTRTLQARGPLLERLKSLPAPTSEEELSILRDASRRYTRLIGELRDCRDQLNEYLKQHKPR